MVILAQYMKHQIRHFRNLKPEHIPEKYAILKAGVILFLT